MKMNVVVIGAGPAGLAVSACLADRGVPHTVYERGDVPLSALRQVDPEMQLLTPTALSRLPGMSLAGDPVYLRLGELVQRIERWRSERNIQVVSGINIERISRANDFLLSYSRNGEPGEVHASHVVNATGIITYPKLPADFDPRIVEFKWHHSIAVRSPDIAAARRLLVVGAGTSGAEVLERWLELRRPGDRAWLSVRRPIHAAP